MYGKCSCILPVTWTYGEKSEVSYTCYSSRIEAELKNAAQKILARRISQSRKTDYSKIKFSGRQSDGETEFQYLSTQT
jgi:predicted adenine nucleotide alpha hydrolase (AANH) superfamily ATPase